MKNSEMPNMTITDETTLGDLEANDRDNYSHIKTKTYAFTSKATALKFMGDTFDKIMGKLGIEIKPNSRAERIDKMLKKQGVKVEQRTYPPEEPLYKSGLYVYKRGDLAGFVSSPFIQESKLYLYKFYIETTEGI